MYFFRDLSLKFVSKSIGSHAGHIFLHADPLPGRAQYPFRPDSDLSRIYYKNH
jgi:hypothetical protein